MFRKLALLLVAGLVILPFTSAATRSPASEARQPTVQPAETAALIAAVPARSVSGAGHSELLGGLFAATIGIWFMKSRIA